MPYLRKGSTATCLLILPCLQLQIWLPQIQPPLPPCRFSSFLTRILHLRARPQRHERTASILRLPAPAIPSRPASQIGNAGRDVFDIVVRRRAVHPPYLGLDNASYTLPALPHDAVTHPEKNHRLDLQPRVDTSTLPCLSRFGSPTHEQGRGPAAPFSLLNDSNRTNAPARVRRGLHVPPPASGTPRRPCPLSAPRTSPVHDPPSVCASVPPDSRPALIPPIRVTMPGGREAGGAVSIHCAGDADVATDVDVTGAETQRRENAKISEKGILLKIKPMS
ncbi:hypothetical protein B0H11DRAFT_2200334 [Mycena galericulata]|nr:hypothetical protein B0H11DRAFT_2200334 [Mycena galericulata]